MLQAGSHCDFETITLLFAKGAGLEVCPGMWALSLSYSPSQALCRRPLSLFTTPMLSCAQSSYVCALQGGDLAACHGR